MFIKERKRVGFAYNLGLYFDRIFLVIYFKTLGFILKFRMFNKFYLFCDFSKIILKISQKDSFKKFMFALNFLFSGLASGFYFDLQMRGLGFRFKKWRRIRKLRAFKILLGYSSYLLMFESNQILAKRIRKQEVILFSPFLRDIKDLVAHMLLFRVIRPYRKFKGVLDWRIIQAKRMGKELSLKRKSKRKKKSKVKLKKGGKKK